MLEHGHADDPLVDDALRQAIQQQWRRMGQARIGRGRLKVKRRPIRFAMTVAAVAKTTMGNRNWSGTSR